MNKEDKELLLKDLCARLMYEVKVTWDGEHSLTVTPHIYCAIVSEDNINNLPKLLLRPISSMTDEEREEYQKFLFPCPDSNGKVVIGVYHRDLDKVYDWLNTHHFDYRGLIEKGLAIEMTDESTKEII